MAQPRRMAVDGAKMRGRFMDAAESILCDEGYPGISARHVAERAGLKTQLLYYYFHTMDDLLLGVVQRVNERRMERFEKALASRQPLRSLWELNSDPSGAALSSELTSIANHREAIREEIVRSAKLFRERLIEAATRLIATSTAANKLPTAGIVMIAVALGRILATESALGLSDGHPEARQIVEHMLATLEGPAG